eukprot:5398542-Amphidinium_carterae.1
MRAGLLGSVGPASAARGNGPELVEQKRKRGRVSALLARSAQVLVPSDHRGHAFSSMSTTRSLARWDAWRRRRRPSSWCGG